MTTFDLTNIGAVKKQIENNWSELAPSKAVVLQMYYTQSFVHEGVNALLKPFDLSMEQFNVLRILRGQKGQPASMGFILEHMVARTSNTTRLVDKLVSKELVTRKICPNNRRQMEVEITAKGLQMLQEVDPKIDAFEQQMCAHLTSEEIQQLNTLLAKYRQKNEM